MNNKIIEYIPPKKRIINEVYPEWMYEIDLLIKENKIVNINYGEQISGQLSECDLYILARKISDEFKQVVHERKFIDSWIPEIDNILTQVISIERENNDNQG